MKPTQRAGLLLLWALPAFAQQVPAFNGTQPGGLDDGGVPFESALTRCRTCHDVTSSDETVFYMPFDGWVSSMMGNSARDPLYRAAVAVANQDVPGIGAWCLRCHSPQAWVRGHTNPPDGGAFDAIDFEGVNCDGCHRSVVPANVSAAPFIGNAQLYFDPSTKKHGPYDGTPTPAHDVAQSSFTGSSELCGQCHQVSNPFTGFPIDTTYEEWKQSDFARDGGSFRSCADCHLPRFSLPDGGTRFNVAKFGALREKPRRHVLVGGNLFGLDAVLKGNPQLAEFSDQFAVTRSLTQDSLRSAVKLELLPEPSGLSARVTNLTGHKFPTGYGDGRRAWLQVEVDGKVVSGGVDGGVLVGAAPLRIWEAQHGKGGVFGEHLALHDSLVKDTRIPPKGFVATPNTKVVGANGFTLADGGYSPTDAVAIPVTQGAVVVRLLWQSTTPEYVAFLAKENRTDDAGTWLKETAAAVGFEPFELASANALVSSQGGADAGSSEPNPPVKPGCGCGAVPSGVWVLSAVAWGLRNALRRSRAGLRR